MRSGGRNWSDGVHHLVRNGSRILLMDTVRGLAEEGDRVLEAALEFDPDVMAIAISREELAGLLDRMDDMDLHDLTNYDELYCRFLSRYGKVTLPPADLVAAVRYASERGIPLRTLDLSEKRMTEISLRYITPMETMRYGVLMRNIRGRRFRAKTAREFALEWDRIVLKLRGFRKVEMAREREISARISALARRYRRIMAVVEAQRCDGILRRLVEDHRMCPASEGGDENS